MAWRITEDRPLTGVGLHNFTVHSPRYVRQPGRLDFVDLIAERPHAVHNTYLELLTETGVVGLGLFLAVVSASLGAAWKAARQFEHQGDEPSATLARGVAVSEITSGIRVRSHALTPWARVNGTHITYPPHDTQSSA